MSGHRRPDVRVFDDGRALAAAGAALFLNSARETVDAGGRFTVALAGGTTPKSVYARLAESAGDPGVPWAEMHFFWGDERHVPPDHPESNARMAREALLDRVPIAPSQIHRIKAEMTDAHEAAAGYEAELRAFFHLAASGWPRFDFVLLGLGADGHTASLFPGTAALSEQERLVVATTVEKLGERITLTAPVLNQARRVVGLVSGDNKAEAVAAVLEGSRQPHRYPGQMVQPIDGELIWLLDRAAASKLSEPGGSTR